MPLSRRTLLGAGLAAPLGLAAGFTASTMARMAGEAIARMRPAAAGTSSSRCARCGDPGHTMLDPVCPLDRRVTRDAA